MSQRSELLELFRAEVQETLEELFAGLELPPDQWDIQNLFRCSHNIKGAVRMTEVAPLERAANLVEDLFGALRDGMPVTDEAIRLAREGCFMMDGCFAALDGEPEPEYGGQGRAD